MRKISTNHGLVLMYMNLAHNVFMLCAKSSMDQPVHRIRLSPTFCGRKALEYSLW